LTDIGSLIDGCIQELVDDGPTDNEMERGMAQAEAHFMYRLQTVGGFGGKSDQLNAYNVFLKDPGFFDRDMERYHDVTAASLRDAVRRYLANSNRISLSIVPKGKTVYALTDSVPSLVS
jgi:zinc protease